MAEERMDNDARQKQIAQELVGIRQLLTEAIKYLREAESEVHEKMRRFVMYWHDIHDIANIYEERGHQVPPYVLKEMERCDDRFRQLIAEAHDEGGTFAKVRAEMASDPNNRWDHTRQLAPPTHKKEPTDAGQSKDGHDSVDEG